MPRYSMPAIILHWLMAVLMILTLGAGLRLDDMPLSLAKLQLINYHKWAGVTVLLLAALRLVWRLYRQPPSPLPGLAPHERWLSAAVHWGLYLLMFALPLTGWLMSSAKGFPVMYFGVLPLPDLVGKDRELAEMLGGIHFALAMSFIVLLLLHLAGAFKHQWLDGKPILYRMGAGRAPQSAQPKETP